MSIRMNTILQSLHRDNPKEIFCKTFFTDDDISFIKWEEKMSLIRLSKWRQEQVQTFEIGDPIKSTFGNKSLGDWIYGHVCFKGKEHLAFDSVEGQVIFVTPGSGSWVQKISNEEIATYKEFKSTHRHD